MRRHWWQRSAQPSPDAVPAGQPASEAVPPSLLAWAQAVDVSRLSDKTVRQVEWYLRGYRHMTLNDTIARLGLFGPQPGPRSRTVVFDFRLLPGAAYRNRTDDLRITSASL
jgi:hypothetical protein